eukprot:gb/GFBE01044393.1/.p1 GENE.gb/GFBE01044393.1/~~gb/GFBE01044393.1/.p1  ORF type:complete len:1636 (+),score=289.78 gb/GFBE01044393.1/:1-4908(+)
MARHGRTRTSRGGRIVLLASSTLALLGAAEEDSWTVRCNAGCGGVDTCTEQQLCSGDMVEMGICPDAPQCPDDAEEECVPQDCMWGEWRDWENDGVSGLCQRTRSFTPSRCGGTQCFGTSSDTMYCEPFVHAPEPCLFNAWSQWTECDQNMLQRWRTRTVAQEPKYGGTACEGPLTMTEPCGQRSAPVHCELGDWMEWSGCSRECNGGQQMQVRGILREAAAGGELCKGEDGAPLVLQRTRPCNVDIPCADGPMPKDCLLTSWGEWSTCDPDVPRRARQRYRSRSVAVPGENGGAPCDTSLEETKACEASDVQPPVDCRLSAWTNWRLCDKTCEGGQTFRTRMVEVEAQRGGKQCEDSTLETQPCNEIPCSFHPEGADCQLSQWTYWTDCSTTCGQGIRKRFRDVLSQPLETGMGCNAMLEEVNGCFDNPPCASQDCEWGYWTQWSDCSRSCDGGQRSRQRSVFLPNSGSGRQCEAMESVNEIEACGTAPCSSAACADGSWHDWGSWGQCSRACGGGMRWRHRKIAIEAEACGQPAVGLATEEEACNPWKCEVDRDCEMGDWDSWGSCSASCEGQQVRKREIAVQGSGNGKWCLGPAGMPEPLEEIRACNGPEDFQNSIVEECGFGEPQDCILSTWTSWSACSVSCGGGVHKRTREPLRHARLGGKPCQDDLEEEGTCGTGQCGMIMDCEWDDWAEWGGCNRCDGERIRIREIMHLGNRHGKPCESSASREVAQCNNCPAKKMYWCVWSDWAEDGSCSATCGTGGKTRRERTLLKTEVPPENPADAVGNVTGNEASCQATEVDYTECKNVPVECTTCVPQNCTFGEWADWEQPQDCDGLCSRARKITQLNNDCGAACSGGVRDTKQCIIPDCEGKQACTFSHWSVWSGCEDDSRQQVRVREIAVQTGPLGAACEGPQKETKPCESEADVVHCELSQWSQWGNCSRMCGGGQQERSRNVQKHAQGGLPCNGSMRMTRPCGEGVCQEANHFAGENDCMLGDWSEWKGCDNGNQAYRTREPVQEARHGGLPCSGTTRESGPCPEADRIDCVFSDWAPWGSCGATCGGGQRFRTREVLVEAQPGGYPCSGDTHETQTCSEEVSCNVETDCVVSHWSLWSECSVSCGQGIHLRQRKILQAASPAGVGCNVAMLEVTGCMGASTNLTCADNVDCRWGGWSQWSDCQQAEFCGLGHRTRTRNIDAQPRGRGEPCDPLPAQEVQPDVTCAKSCTKDDACVDGEWADWGKWGQCSVTCGRGGTRQRKRTEKIKANHCGSPAAGDQEQFESCDAEIECETQFGQQDCQFGQWQQWGECSATCNGARKRSRAIAVYSAYGGAPCAGAVSESERCNPGPGEDSTPLGCHSGAPVDCVQTPFLEWSSCSATCGTGHQSRKREVAVQPAFGGKSCQNPLEEIQECNATEPCVVLTRDCQLSDWQDWSECDVLTAQETRTRFVKVAQAGFGAACEGNKTETRGCSRICEDKTYYCGWGAWKQWTECSTSCGIKGRRQRSRSLLLTEAANSGPAVETQAGAFVEGSYEPAAQPEAADVSASELAMEPDSFAVQNGFADPSAFEAKFALLSRRLEISSKSQSLELVAAFSAGLLTVGAVLGLAKVAFRRIRTGNQWTAIDPSARQALNPNDV